MIPSKYQQRIYEEYDNTRNNIAVEACPGSGKTTVLLNILKRTPSYKKCIFLAFNKSIANELGLKVPEYVEVSTLHSLGFKILRQNLRLKFKLNEYKNWILLKDHIKKQFKTDKDKNIYLFTISRLYDLYRMNLCSTVEEIIPIAEDRSIDFSIEDLQDLQMLIEISDKYNNRDHGSNDFMIDFTDMIYLTNVLVEKEDFPKYDVVLFDECLPYHMPVLLSDGSSLPIGKIVEEKLNIEVLTYNIKTKKQEFNRVIGWHRSFNEKKMYKIKGHNKHNHNIRSFVVCTFNHKLYVKDIGYVYAEDLKEGMVIQFETRAEKTTKYKITKRGRETLAETMKIKNDFIKENNLKFNIKNTGNNLKRGSKDRGGNGIKNNFQLEFLEDIIKTTGCNDWVDEYVVKTNVKRSSIYPYHYKIDIANPNKKIAIELDGDSHKGVRILKDNKKDDFLINNGWFVKRIKNLDLAKNYSEILNSIKYDDFSFCYDGKNCPVDLIIDSIEEIDIPEKYVYDIEVEGNHNFYANGILVHNCQDGNKLHKMIVNNILKPKGRLISVGDSYQSIYSFQGSTPDVFKELKQLPNTIELPLSVSYRCSKNIIKEANKVFNKIEAPDNAIDGIVRQGKLNEVQSGDFVLCRNNLPLIETYINLIKQGKRAFILGKDLGKSLLKIVEKVRDIDIKEADDRFSQMLKDKEEELKKRGVKSIKNNKSYQSFQEYISIVKILGREFNSFVKLDQVINDLFKEDNKDQDSVTLSTIHKSKGLESDRVFAIGNRELIPSKYSKTELELYAENCLKYVCITRARKEFVYVPLSDVLSREVMDQIIDSEEESVMIEAIGKYQDINVEHLFKQ